VASRREIEAEGWSLHPGRYVGATEVAEAGIDFGETLARLTRELEHLGRQARKLEGKIAKSAKDFAEP
jgi:type I restriction enzyme M protein